MRKQKLLSGAMLLLALAVVIPSAHAQRFRVLHEFEDGQRDGASPSGSVVLDSAGNLYGTTGFGGLNAAGVVYKIDTTGAEGILFAFDVADGTTPNSGLIIDQAGNMYGTADGGANDEGVIFRVSPSGEETVLFDFPETTALNPIHPSGSLLMDSLGNLYGATTLGGHGNCLLGCGDIYELDPSGNVRVLHQFSGSTDGLSPLGGLAMDPSGNLYGVAQLGGDFACSAPGFEGQGCGTVFRITRNGKFNVLHGFRGGADGEIPQAGLLVDTVTGSLYGAAAGGNGSGNGVVFRISSQGRFSVLHQFTGLDGSNPNGKLISDEVGNIYGTTQGGGANGLGTAFVMSPTGQLKVLHNFTGGLDGMTPLGGLTRDSAGNLFGTAFKNLTTQTKEGDVFEITP